MTGGTEADGVKAPLASQSRVTRVTVLHFRLCERQSSFGRVRSDNLILRLAKAAGEVLGKTHDELMYAFGVYMVKRIGNYGYERILKVRRRRARRRWADPE